MTVRVIRVLEYNYETHEQAEKDMANWGVPAHGVKAFNKWQSIQSATMFAQTVAHPGGPQALTEAELAVVQAARRWAAASSSGEDVEDSCEALDQAMANLDNKVLGDG